MPRQTKLTTDTCKCWLSAMCLLLLAACSEPPPPAVSAQQLQALIDRVQYLEDMNAIQKLQAKYVHYLFTQRFDRIVPELYSHETDDVSVEFSDSGVYRGLDSVTALYQDFVRTRDVPGFFIMHMAVDPYIEIAGDGMSARSHWLSPGATNSPSGSGWVWGPYYVDYVKENGEWRIHHSNLDPLFRNPYEISWGKATDNGSVKRMLSTTPDEPSTLYRPFNEVKEETHIFRNHPDLPEPY